MNSKGIIAIIALFLAGRILRASNEGLPVDEGLINFSFKGHTFPPNKARGMKINNPGNLRDFGQPWVGRVVPSSDRDFYEFKSYAYGLRAMIKLLQNYIRQGNNTIESILYRYAPPSENKTSDYIAYVERRSRIPRRRVLTGTKEELRKIIGPMADLEQGVPARTDEFFNTAYSLI